MSRCAHDPLYRHRHPRAFPTCRLATLATSIPVIAAAGTALADDSALVLSNEHLDMTRAEIEAPPPVGTQPAPFALWQADSNPTAAMAPAWGSEFLSNEDLPQTDCAQPSTAASGVIASFAQCIEVSIRAGVGYDQASPVCRAIFPGPS